VLVAPPQEMSFLGSCHLPPNCEFAVLVESVVPFSASKGFAPTLTAGWTVASLFDGIRDPDIDGSLAVARDTWCNKGTGGVIFAFIGEESERPSLIERKEKPG
jgi:hypothetical protein